MIINLIIYILQHTLTHTRSNISLDRVCVILVMLNDIFVHKTRLDLLFLRNQLTIGKFIYTNFIES